MVIAVAVISVFLVALLAFAIMAMLPFVRAPPSSDPLATATLAASIAAGAGSLILAIVTYALVDVTAGLRVATERLAEQQKRDLDRRAAHVVLLESWVGWDGDNTWLNMTLRNDGETATVVTKVTLGEWIGAYSHDADGFRDFEGPEPLGSSDVDLAKLKKREGGAILRIAPKEVARIWGKADDLGDLSNTLYFDVEVTFAEGPPATGVAKAHQAPPEGESE